MTAVSTSARVIPYPGGAADPALELAGRALREGALVVFPTETVYGVAASAACPQATARLRRLKSMDNGQVLTVHLARPAEARHYVSRPSVLLRRLARKAWPGPLTIICDESTPEATAVARVLPPGQWGEIYGRGMVSLRCPDHAGAAALLEAAATPVVAVSANRPGRPPAWDVQDALRELRDEVEYVLDAGATRLRCASTVIRVHGNRWTMQRRGALDERSIARMATREILFVCTGNSCRSPMAEHMFRHELARRLGVLPQELEGLGYVIGSAGTAAPTGEPMTAGSLRQLERRGISAAAHRTRPLTVDLIQRAERICVMSAEHEERVLDLVPGAAGRVRRLDPTGPIADPIGGGPEEYERCASRIERAVAALAEEWIHEDLDW